VEPSRDDCDPAESAYQFDPNGRLIEGAGGSRGSGGAAGTGGASSGGASSGGASSGGTTAVDAGDLDASVGDGGL
jgi:hypothetical protein